MKTIYEISKSGKRAVTFAPISVPEYTLDSTLTRDELNLPSVAEVDLVRHYTALSKRAFGVDDGFYPLGSCTMNSFFFQSPFSVESYLFITEFSV